MRKKTAVQWNANESVAANARARLAPLVADYFARGRKLSSRSEVKEFHDFRLQSKRLRYTLEQFRGCYGPGIDERLARLREVQQRLGDMNDCEATLELLASGPPLTAPQRESATSYLRSKSAEHKDRFLTYWRETFDAAGQETWWVRYLARAKAAS
jgi:CHAD domain-containing protein